MRSTWGNGTDTQYGSLTVVYLGVGGALNATAPAGLAALLELAGNGLVLGTSSLAIGQTAAGVSTILARGAQALNIGVNGGSQLAISSVGAFTITDNTGTLWGAPTGGAQGAGTINVVGAYFVNGVQLTVGSNVVNFATSNPTVALVNAGQTYRSTVTTLTVTIPANGAVAFPVGTMLTFINSGGGVMSIAITTDTMTLANTATTGTRSLAVNGIATAIKITTTSWLISGNGLT